LNALFEVSYSIVPNSFQLSLELWRELRHKWLTTKVLFPALVSVFVMFDILVA
jgi:hypothetical protein